MKRIFLLLGTLLSFTFPSHAGDVKILSQYLQGMSGISGEFVQHTYDGKGALLQTQQGLLSLKRPNKFRWESQEPYAQLLLSDGETLWQYDEDLEQVSIQKLDQRLSVTPALLLTGSVENIGAEYDVYGEQLQDEYHFVLIPKGDETLFDRLRLEFDGNRLLSRMIIKDEVGQKTTVQLLSVKKEPHMKSSLFTFDIPPGIDVIRSE